MGRSQASETSDRNRRRLVSGPCRKRTRSSLRWQKTGYATCGGGRRNTSKPLLATAGCPATAMAAAAARTNACGRHVRPLYTPFPAGSLPAVGIKVGRSVAQPGSALASGARGREFESRRSDQQIQPFLELTRTSVGGNVGELKSKILDLRFTPSSSRKRVLSCDRMFMPVCARQSCSGATDAFITTCASRFRIPPNQRPVSR